MKFDLRMGEYWYLFAVGKNLELQKDEEILIFDVWCLMELRVGIGMSDSVRWMKLLSLLYVG